MADESEDQSASVEGAAAATPEAPIAEAAAPATPTALAQRFELEIARWRKERLHGSAVAHATAAWNHLMAEWPGLARRLAAIVEEE